jgi:putative MFS transporter
MGAVLAVFVSREVTWRTSYFIGGAMGLALLLLRIGVAESGMFKTLKKTEVSRGNFFQLVQSWPRFKRYLCLILSGVPIWYAVGILITFSPELGAKLGVSPVPVAGDAVALMYAGLAAGDLLSGFASQVVKSRKKVVAAFIVLCGVCTGLYFTVGAVSRFAFYTVCVLLGIANGYWAVFVTMASEQFGTNLRATVTTSAPNFVRGAVVILTTAFTFLDPHLGIVGSAIAVGIGALAVALFSLSHLEETYGKDLDYVER